MCIEELVEKLKKYFRKYSFFTKKLELKIKK